MTARKYAPICSYPNCGRPHNARGLCGPHGAMKLRGEDLRPLQDRTGPLERSAIERFVERIALTDAGCLEWIGGMYGSGYGAFFPGGPRDSGNVGAHRWSHEAFVGPIPDDYDVDHLCRNRACVHPEHLEAVTRAENIRRVYADRTHCSAGHELIEQNIRRISGTAQRRCTACELAKGRKRAPERNAARRAARLARGLMKHGPAPADRCRRGHEMTAANSYYAPKSGIRSCRECRRINVVQQKAAV